MATEFNILDTIQSQYSSSKRIMALITGFARLINPQSEISVLFNNYIDVDTAVGTGLDNWGRIVGLNRTVNNITLNDNDYRTFLKIKMAANISGSTLKDLNIILNKIFKDRGLCYVRESGLMVIRYEFFFQLSDTEKTFLNSEAIMPRPAGVGFSSSVVVVGNIIGFEGQNLGNFFQTNFGA